MSSDLQSFLEFLEEQRALHAPHFPGLDAGQVLAFMGTTNVPGSFAACSVNRLVRLERGSSPQDLRIVLGGALPRPPREGECISVHLTRVERYQGYQVKTRALAAGTALADLCERAAGGLVVKGAQIYTVHHSPYTLRFFENVPFEDVAETVGGLRAALVAVGANANLSPRFVFHQEVRDGKLLLFHGDGLALKTYMNVRLNRCETRLVLDLDEHRGFLLRGAVEEFAPHQYPEAYERICRGFTAGSWGKPSRVFRFSPESFERIGPPEP